LQPLITDEVYNEKYCERINDKDWRFKTIPNAVRILYDYFRPKSVVDIGCANGVHLKAFKDLGVEVFGIEGTSHWAPYIEENIGKYYDILDIRKPLKSEESFDLVLCLEVLEHLEKQFARQAVKNILSLGKNICISACPITGGFHHINVQPFSYWQRVFEKQGAIYQKKESELLMSQCSKISCSGWFKDNLRVFRK